MSSLKRVYGLVFACLTLAVISASTFAQAATPTVEMPIDWDATMTAISGVIITAMVVVLGYKLGIVAFNKVLGMFTRNSMRATT